MGAGAAGLMAARVLSRAGQRVAIFEAQDRAGGRMRTAYDPEANAPIEYGPEFVHGTPKISLALLSESGNALVDTGEDSFEFKDGKLAASTGDAFEDAESVIERGAHLAADCSIDDIIAGAVRQGLSAEIAARTRGLVAGFDAADPARASARAIAEEWMGDASAEGASHRTRRGYAHLIAHMLASLDRSVVDVHFSQAVSQISLVDDGVELTLAGGKDVRRVRARAAIVTVPLGVLQAPAEVTGAIVFDPPLPQSHRVALEHLAMGPVRKVVLQFASAFWESLAGGRYRDVAFVSAHGPFPTIWTQMPVRARILTAWAGGPAADALAGLDSQAAIETALQCIIDVFDAPEARELLVRGYEHDWQRDPYSRGAYSYALVNAGSARADLGKPIASRLFIAGEATARGPEGGTVAGALESGETAARAFLAR